jgi:rhodanese-related sulfurtransferase
MTKTITREQIKQKIDSAQSITIVEALPQRYFDAQHLPGALNIPHEEIRALAPNILPRKDALIVVYCANSACQNSKIAASTLDQLGYTNAFEYVEGKQDWIEAGYPIESTQ